MGYAQKKEYTLCSTSNIYLGIACATTIINALRAMVWNPEIEDLLLPTEYC
jgi:hypothetical protein